MSDKIDKKITSHLIDIIANLNRKTPRIALSLIMLLSTFLKIFTKDNWIALALWLADGNQATTLKLN